MSFEQTLSVLSVVVFIASLVPLAVPLVYVLRRRGSLARKGLLLAGTFAGSWLVAVALLVVLVLPALKFEEPLTVALLSDPSPPPVLVYIQSAVKAVGQYWYFVGQVAVPLVAALASIPICVKLCKVLFPNVQGAEDAA
jgi:hypothetical protein